MSSDERLALRAAKGDSRAFEAIYERYHQALYRFCLAMVGNPQDAQDALQNTMVKVLRALPGETREIKLKPWLYRVARNEAVETLRRRRDNEELEPQQGAGAAVTEVAETRERLRTLLADLEQLPERQRAALVMRELSGLDFAQIGASFGSSAAVARQTLYEARLSLRQLEAGREMPCAEVMRELSDADGRVTRRREIRAHLRGCPDCRAFHDSIAERRENLAALAPLPLAASAGLLHGLLGSAKASGTLGGTASGGLAGTVGAGAGKAVTTSAIVKSVATVAVVAAVGASAGDRAGLVDLPLPSQSGHASSQGAAGAQGSSGGDSSATGATSVGRGSGAHGQNSSHSAGAKDGDRQGKGTNAEGSGNHGNSAGKNGSRSQSGLAPPGGGYGRSASSRHGRPEQPPEAAGHGQRAAGAHGNGASRAASHPQGPPRTPPKRGAGTNGHPSKSSAPPAESTKIAPDDTGSSTLEPSTEANKGAAEAAAH
jgi:RNA polymerase sigma factor (sigma-70 family)